MRALLGTASHVCEAVVLELRAVPLGRCGDRGAYPRKGGRLAPGAGRARALAGERDF